MPRPMYFLAIETTSRRLAEVRFSRPSLPMRTSTPRRSRALMCDWLISGSQPISDVMSESWPLTIQRWSASCAVAWVQS